MATKFQKWQKDKSVLFQTPISVELLKNSTDQVSVSYYNAAIVANSAIKKLLGK